MVFKTFSKVCLAVLSLTLLAGEKIRIGGFALKTLKKLNGDKFGLPFSLIVLAKAMGLGATELNKYWCNLGVEIFLGRIVNNCIDFLTKVTNICKSNNNYNFLKL